VFKLPLSKLRHGTAKAYAAQPRSGRRPRPDALARAEPTTRLAGDSSSRKIGLAK
jgi:hypothetical protein